MKVDSSFTVTLESVLCGMHDLMEATHTGPANKYEIWMMKEEFLRTLLDFLQVARYGYAPSTFSLNENACFLLENLPVDGASMEFNWASVIGDECESFESAYRNKLIPRCQELSFDLDDCSSTYYMVGTGESISLELMQEVDRITGGGFTVDQAIGLFQAEARGAPGSFQKEAFTGFLVDEALRNRLRVSVWALWLQEKHGHTEA